MDTITLVVKHTTTCAAWPHVDQGEIVSVVVNGEEREPKSPDFGAACTWLQARGYVPQEFKWIDRAGIMVRRRRCTYVKEA
jgi:hypothetical protein